MTGERRVMDTAGRVERFRRRYEKKEQPKKEEAK
jgi:ribosomal protein L31